MEQLNSVPADLYAAILSTEGEISLIVDSKVKLDLTAHVQVSSDKRQWIIGDNEFLIPDFKIDRYPSVISVICVHCGVPMHAEMLQMVFE